MPICQPLVGAAAIVVATAVQMEPEAEEEEALVLEPICTIAIVNRVNWMVFYIEQLRV